MEERIYNVKLYLYDEPEFDKDIEFFQNDTKSCILNINLYKDRRNAYIVNGNASIQINKNDGTIVLDNLTKVDEGEYTYELPNNTINVVGNHIVTIQCNGIDNDRITFKSFKYKIKAEPKNGDISSQSEYPILTRLIADNNNLKEQIKVEENVRAKNEEVRNTNETTRKSNENVRKDNFNNAMQEYETYKNVMIAESNVAALQNQINTTNTQLEQNVKNISSNLFNSKPTVLMHRGFVGLAPENTMLAIEYADKYGCRGVEIDIRMTKDKVMILHHDATVDRMTNGTGDVNSFNLQEIETLNIDSGTNIGKVGALKIPTLDEILNYIRNTKMVVMLHIYDIDENNIINLVNMLKKYSILERTIISSTNINYLNSFRNIDKSLQLSFITTLVNDSTVNTALSLGNCYLALTLKGYTATDIEYCHSLGIKIVGDTLNTFTDYKRILKNNIDIILSDIYIKREV